MNRFTISAPKDKKHGSCFFKKQKIDPHITCIKVVKMNPCALGFYAVKTYDRHTVGFTYLLKNSVNVGEEWVEYLKIITIGDKKKRGTKNENIKRKGWNCKTYFCPLTEENVYSVGKIAIEQGKHILKVLVEKLKPS